MQKNTILRSSATLLNIVVLSNCSSKFSVGRDLYMYPTLHNGNKTMRENRHDVRLLLLFKKNTFFKCVFYIYALIVDSKTI